MKPTSAGRQRRTLLYPTLIIIAIITQVPFLLTVFLSFYAWNLTRPDLGRVFDGLGNYTTEVLSAEFGRIISVLSARTPPK